MRKNAELLYVTTGNIFGYHGALKRSVAALMEKVVKKLSGTGRKEVHD